MTRYAIGLLLLCLSLLSACTSTPPSPAPQLIEHGCPPVVPCQLPASHPTRNGDFSEQLDAAEAAWARCAAQVDTLYQCQQDNLNDMNNLSGSKP